MKRQYATAFFLSLFFSLQTIAQVDEITTKFNLPSTVKETSGLLMLDGKIITHNDSGDAANLYEIDSLTGNLLRTININNATNIDWEDITMDDTYIYIADIGNNSGDRLDLTIYKVLRTLFANSTTVAAETITFSYEDQTDFTSRPNANNFDAEAITVYNDDLLIFTKNWQNLQTNVYKIPKTTGNHTAVKVSNANVECLITGATYHDNRFFLTAYDTNANPFLIYISFNRMPGDNIFASGFTKISIADKIGQFSQIEGITAFEGNTGKYYLSREEVNFTQGGMNFNFPARLYEFYDETSPLLSTKTFDIVNVTLVPNPTTDFFTIRGDKSPVNFTLYNTLGKLVLSGKNQEKIDIAQFPKGIYVLKMQFDNQQTIVKKIIKN